MKVSDLERAKFTDIDNVCNVKCSAKPFLHKLLCEPVQWKIIVSPRLKPPMPVQSNYW